MTGRLSAANLLTLKSPGNHRLESGVEASLITLVLQVVVAHLTFDTQQFQRHPRPPRMTIPVTSPPPESRRLIRRPPSHTPPSRPPAPKKRKSRVLAPLLVGIMVAAAVVIAALGIVVSPGADRAPPSPPATPMILADSAVNPYHSGQDVTLAWTPVVGARGYRVQIALWSGKPNPRNIFQHPARVILASRTSIKIRVAGDQIYYWRVQPLVGNHWTAFTRSTHFRVAGPVLTIPFSITPEDGSIRFASHIHLCWTPVNGAEGYRLQLSGHRSSLHQSTCAGFSLHPGTYTWRVAAMARGTRIFQGPFSREVKFTVRPRPIQTVALRTTSHRATGKGKRHHPPQTQSHPSHRPHVHAASRSHHAVVAQNLSPVPSGGSPHYGHAKAVYRHFHPLVAVQLPPKTSSSHLPVRHPVSLLATHPRIGRSHHHRRHHRRHRHHPRHPSPGHRRSSPSSSNRPMSPAPASPPVVTQHPVVLTGPPPPPSPAPTAAPMAYRSSPGDSADTPPSRIPPPLPTPKRSGRSARPPGDQTRWITSIPAGSQGDQHTGRSPRSQP